MVEPGGLLSMGLHRVGHDWSDLAAAAAAERNNTQKFSDNFCRGKDVGKNERENYRC